MPGALREYEAAEKMFPQNLEMKYWHAISLASKNQVPAALALLRPIYAADPNWRTLTRRLPKVGLLTVSAAELRQLLSLK